MSIYYVRRAVPINVGRPTADATEDTVVSAPADTYVIAPMTASVQGHLTSGALIQVDAIRRNGRVSWRSPEKA